MPQTVLLRDLHTHTESAVDRALNNMAQNRRPGMLQLQAGMVQRLLFKLQVLPLTKQLTGIAQARAGQLSERDSANGRWPSCSSRELGQSGRFGCFG
mgnify:CR=1 FL=1